MTYVIEFSPPMQGFEGEFNTIRLGIKWSKALNRGDLVYLLDKPKSKLFGRAVVQEVHVGKLGEMATLHAARNHNQKGLDPRDAPQRLIANLTKRYGPHMVSDNKRVTVIYMRLIE